MKKMVYKECGHTMTQHGRFKFKECGHTMTQHGRFKFIYYCNNILSKSYKTFVTRKG
jgi:hypothetical protein